jgi:glycosyltransferase involved in cell wall biosynthesis
MSCIVFLKKWKNPLCYVFVTFFCYKSPSKPAVSHLAHARHANWFRGLMYKQMDHRDLAEKIFTILSDDELRTQIGRKSRKVTYKSSIWEKS